MIPLEKSESEKISSKTNETPSINESTSEKETQPSTKPNNVSHQKEMTPSEEKPSLFDMISKMQEKLINQTNSMASSSATLAQANLNNANIHKSKERNLIIKSF